MAVRRGAGEWSTEEPDGTDAERPSGRSADDPPVAGAGGPIRVLLVEDDDADEGLLRRELRKSGVAFELFRVDDAQAMRDALGASPWDVVISDFHIPGFGANAALDVLKASGHDIPFIVVSGTISEEVAVSVLRAGAHDFILKGKLARLVPAIERELREARRRAEQRGMREQLVIADRMASIGMLAAGVAHEINNPLAAVLANLEYLSQRLGPNGIDVPESLTEALADAVGAADRVREIVRDVKVFSRGAEDRLRAVDVHRVLDSTVRMAWNDLRHRARVVKNYGTVRPVLGSEPRLGQVFLNLIINAGHAIEPGNASENEIRLTTYVDERGRVVVEIGDTGSGMPPELVDKIFTPFFTTKAPGEGTGLGLSITRGIVTALSGEISVSSTVGSGTVFRVAFPAAEGRPDPVKETASNAPAFASGRRGRILVVDDEVLVTAAIRRVLGRGHDVAVAFRGEDAIERIRRGERFDLILCDLMMPAMTGIDVHREIAHVDGVQANNVVFMTGGTFTSEVADFLDRTTTTVLEKPFDSARLVALANEWVR